MNNLKILLAIFLLNLITFIFYGLDKAYAKKHKRRIKESHLILMGLLGGGIGGLLAMKVFKHKSKKLYFYLFNFLGIIFLVFFILFAL
ncbi:MAG: DUF1294 domain-containing protein [Peptoniphilaceae bacterium]|nr:DUF1294 domain-containing protein [Peptoniphilaceae bacterium]MDY6018536.1 DUF1294 domain-containing protein [Anaerococcus sp.]